MGAFYLISGSDDFSVKERSLEMVHSFFGDNPDDDPALEIIRGDDDGDSASIVLEKVIDAIETPSFLSPAKTVWLKHFAKFDDAFSEQSTKKNPSAMDRLSDLLKEGLPSDVTLIIDGAGLDRRKAFFKLADKLCKDSGGKLEWFEKTDLRSKGGAAVVCKKIRELALNAGKRMDDAVATYIAETSGADAARLKNEVEKLASYAGDSKVITMEDCREIASRSPDALSWEFSSALTDLDFDKALSIIPDLILSMEQERSGGNTEIAITSGVHSEFKRLVQLRCAGEKYNIPERASYPFFEKLFAENKENDPGNALFAMHPYKALKTWEKAGNFSDRALAKIFKHILEANRVMVTGGDKRLALELLVAKIASASKLT